MRRANIIFIAVALAISLPLTLSDTGTNITVDNSPPFQEQLFSNISLAKNTDYVDYLDLDDYFTG